MPIRQLSASVVNKIAAGEVVERPASVVKELLENAIDAGATRIDVSLEKGGLELVRVADDGCGIAVDELPLAVASHATSKLCDAEELFRVATLGFRGEALASIAEVSRLTLKSRTPDADAGAMLQVAGGERGEVAPCGCPTGTIIEVRDLFYNTPVRRRFLRSVQTEAGNSVEAFTRLALANPQIHLSLRHHDRTMYDLPPLADSRPRIAALCGEELAESLIPLDSGDGELRVWGYVADPSHSRANAKMQYLFLNGRPIRDRALQHALGEAFRGLLLTGRYPIAFLHLTMPADWVDVNVHPTKLEVRFQDGSRVYGQLLSTLRTRFLTTDLTARGRIAPPESFLADSASQFNDTQSDEMRSQLVDWARARLAAARDELAATGLPWPESSEPQIASAAVDEPRRAPLDLVRLDRIWHPVGEEEHAPVDDFSPSAPAPSEWGDHFAVPHAPHALRPAKALQIHNRYLVTESAEGVVVIDQHALHERILYEQLRARVLSESLEAQRLLAPEPVDLSPAEAAAALEHRELLGQLGIGIDAFGGDTVLVSSYPAMLANMVPGEVLRGVIDQLLAGGKTPQRRDLLDELLHMISCKAAIKAGDHLSPEEIEALLDQRHLAQDSHHCPHGRPTSLVFTPEELDRQFKRT